MCRLAKGLVGAVAITCALGAATPARAQVVDSPPVPATVPTPEIPPVPIELPSSSTTPPALPPEDQPKAIGESSDRGVCDRLSALPGASAVCNVAEGIGKAMQAPTVIPGAAADAVIDRAA